MVAGGKWIKTVSVLDVFVAAPADNPLPVTQLVVTLGTIEGFGFFALISRLVEIVPLRLRRRLADRRHGRGRPGPAVLRSCRSMPQRELQAAMRSAHVVVAHSGIGSALGALAAGRRPVLVPMRAVRGEHVDDHQVQIACELERRGLAVYREVTDLNWRDIEAASRVSVGTSASLPAAGESSV